VESWTNGGELSGGKEFGAFDQFEPVTGFFEFLQGAFDLADEIGGGFRSLRLAVVGADGCGGTDDLPAQHPRDFTARKRCVETDDS